MGTVKTCVNGVVREMTASEIAELEKIRSEAPAPPPTPEERIAALEEENKKLKEHSNLLEECIVEMAEIIYKE